MNFLPESGYDVALRFFRSLGLPINDKNSQSLPSSVSRGQNLPRAVAPITTNVSAQSSRSGKQNSGYNESTASLVNAIPLFDIPNKNSSPFSPDSSYIGYYGGYNQGLQSLTTVEPNLASSFIGRAVTSHGYPTHTSTSPENLAERPVTAPMTLSEMLPPRREIPFLRPSQEKRVFPETGTVSSISKPVGSQGLPRKGNAKAVRKNKERAAKRSTSRETCRPAIEGDQKPSLVVSLKVSAPSQRASSPDIPSSHAVPISSPVIRPATATSSINPSTRTKKPTTVPEKPLSVLGKFAKDFENISPEEYMDRLDHWVREYQDLPAPKSLQSEKEKMAEYAARPEEERVMVIDQMIMECLEDENFGKLVEDVEKSWKRVALGF